MKDKDVVIELKNASKTFYIRDKRKESVGGVFSGFVGIGKFRKIEAVKNVSVQIRRGEFVGIVGANGSGKSTLLLMMSGVYRPDKGGYSSIKGNYMRLSLGLGFNAELTARENIFINASLMGLTFRETNRKFNKIIRFAELEKFVDTKIKYYSRGMKARLGFAVAIHASPDILLLDEIFGGVGDEKFRAKSEKVFKKKLLEGRTIVLVSHNLSVVKDHADRVMYMHEGKCPIVGNHEEVFMYYQKALKIKKLKLHD